MPGSLRIAIVGGGIGGLTAALALRARGLAVTVFEQAEVLKEIGAGVSIYPNAARLLKRVGLDDQLRQIGSPISGITLRTSQGEAIATPEGPATPAFSPDGGVGYSVHRADFLNLLFAALPKGRNGQSRSPVHPAQGRRRSSPSFLREWSFCRSRCRDRR